MDIKAIKETIDNPLLDDEIKRSIIVSIISKDEQAINDVLAILAEERRRKKELISDFNVLLSKSDIALDEPTLNKDNFIQEEIKTFFIKWKGFARHLWKDF